MPNLAFSPRRLTLATLAGAALLLGGCHGGVLDPRGPVAAAEKTLLIDSMSIMLAIVVPTIVALLAFAFWFRASNRRATYRPDWSFSGQLELITWSIPLLTIMLLGGVTYVSSHELDPAKPLASNRKPLEVQVVALDWKWLFIYPEQGIASVNQLAIPAGEPVHFSLTSSSVLNSFFVPQLGSMIYAMPGMVSQLNLSADQPGTFAGRATHISGDGFSDMHFDVQALPPADFAAWVAAARQTGRPLDATAYRALAVQSIAATPFTFRSAAPGLFQQIVSFAEPPGPGPNPGQPNIAVHPKTEP